VNFGSLIPILDQYFAFPLHVEHVFFSSCDSRERGWKVVLRKDPCGKRIIENIQLDLTKFDMFRVGNVDDYSRLQVLVFIQKTNQLPTIVRWSIVSVTCLNVDDSEGDQENGFDSLENYASNNSNDA
jgi:hypothetical protein